MQNETRMVNKYELSGINSGMQRMTGHQKTIGANWDSITLIHSEHLHGYKNEETQN